jgi:hypothetical protein
MHYYGKPSKQYALMEINLPPSAKAISPAFDDITQRVGVYSFDTHWHLTFVRFQHDGESTSSGKDGRRGN